MKIQKFLKASTLLSILILGFICYEAWKDQNGELRLSFFSAPGTQEKSIAMPVSQSSSSMPYLFQFEEPIASAPYGPSTIRTSGCGPTSLVMVLDSLLEREDLSVQEAARYAYENGYFEEGVGTYWAFFADYADEFNIDARQLDLQDSFSIEQALRQNQPLIFCMNPGDFTTTGHILAAEKLEDGMIEVHDPNSRERSRKWPLETVIAQAAGVFTFQIR